MLKRIIFISLIAVFAYYAGAQGLTSGDVVDWFTGSDFLQISKETLKELFELAEEKQVVEKTSSVIDNLKEKVSN